MPWVESSSSPALSRAHTPFLVTTVRFVMQWVSGGGEQLRLTSQFTSILDNLRREGKTHQLCFASEEKDVGAGG